MWSCLMFSSKVDVVGVDGHIGGCSARHETVEPRTMQRRKPLCEASSRCTLAVLALS